MEGDISAQRRNVQAAGVIAGGVLLVAAWLLVSSSDYKHMSQSTSLPNITRHKRITVADLLQSRELNDIVRELAVHAIKTSILVHSKVTTNASIPLPSSWEDEAQAAVTKHLELTVHGLMSSHEEGISQLHEANLAPGQADALCTCCAR